MAMFETLVQLFAAFAKIGFTSFGGTSMIPLIMDEMSSHGWMTDADLTNLIAIAEMTPGSPVSYTHLTLPTICSV